MQALRCGSNDVLDNVIHPLILNSFLGNTIVEQKPKSYLTDKRSSLKNCELIQNII